MTDDEGARTISDHCIKPRPSLEAKLQRLTASKCQGQGQEMQPQPSETLCPHISVGGFCFPVVMSLSQWFCPSSVLIKVN